MIKKDIIVNEIEFNDDGKVKALKGIVRKRSPDVINASFSRHFCSETLKIMFWAQFELDYCGG